MKTCSKCGESKVLSEFHKHKRGKEGRAAWCKLCSKENYDFYYVKNREKLVAKQKVYYFNNKATRASYKRGWHYKKAYGLSREAMINWFLNKEVFVSCAKNQRLALVINLVKSNHCA